MMNVLIADDHDIVIRGLKDLLQNEFDDLSIGEAKNYRDILARLEERKWDLILLDIIMPELNVVDMVVRIRRDDPGVPILILTAVSETEYAVRTLAAGANGYITKHHAADELIQAVHKVLSGEIYYSSKAVGSPVAGQRGERTPIVHETLSQRELEVFCLIARGRAVKEIAFELSVSAKTVSTYIARIREKTGLENYVDIARYALRRHLVD